MFWISSSARPFQELPALQNQELPARLYQELPARPYQELPARPYQELPLASYQELQLASPCASQELPLASTCGRGPRLRAEHCKLDLMRQKSWVTFMGGGDRRPKRAGLLGCRGLMVMASGWQSFDRQFEPYLRAFMAAPLRCGLGCRSRTDGRIHLS